MFERIRAAAGAPSGREVLEDLIELHSARPGITEATLGRWTTADGLTGYDVLVQALPEAARSVLDLGSGNGPLTERLLARAPKLERVVALDACASELELLRQRTRGDARALVWCGPAEELSLEDATLDAVLSHHALYLMRPIEPVLRRLARVLRPGGLLAFVTWSNRAATLEPFSSLMRAMSPLTARDAPHFRGWGDPRMFSDAGLAELLIESGLFEALSWEEHTLAIAEPPAELVEHLMGFFYSVELQRTESQAELRREWTAILGREVDAAGLARLGFPFACVRARRRQGSQKPSQLGL